MLTLARSTLTRSRSGWFLPEEEVEEIVEPSEAKLGEGFARASKIREVEVEALRGAGMTVAIVLGSLVGIRKNLVGLRRTFEFLFRLFSRIGVLVRMQFLCFLAVGLFDLLLIRLARDPEGFVIISFGHAVPLSNQSPYLSSLSYSASMYSPPSSSSLLLSAVADDCCSEAAACLYASSASCCELLESSCMT